MPTIAPLTRTSKRKIYYSRCLGSDDYRYEHGRVCSNAPLRQDYLDALVWDAVVDLLADPSLVQQELDRRLSEREQSSPAKNHEEELQRELTRYEKASSRLIEAYQEELITLEELRGRIGDLRKKMNAAKAQLDAVAAQMHNEEVYLRLCENFETFLANLYERAQTLSVEDRQKVLRLIVKEIHVGQNGIVIKHSIPSSEGGPTSGYPLRLGSQYPALRGTRNGVLVLAIFGQDACFAERLDQPQDTLVSDTSPHPVH